MTLPKFKTPIQTTARLLSDMDGDGPGLASLCRALDECSSICRELDGYLEGVMADNLLSDTGKEQQISKHGSAALRGADKILANALGKADGDITKLESELAKGLPALADGDHSGEIRAHIKGLPGGERRAFMLAAQQSDDTATVAAVLNAPSFLSGLTDADLEVVVERRKEAAAKASPRLARQLEALKTAHGRVQLARQSLNAERQRAFGDASASVAA